MELSDEQRAMLPTDEDVAFYEEHGWYISPKILSDDVIDEAARGADRHWAGERDWPLPITEGFKDWRPGDPDTIRVGEIIALQNREVRRLVEQPIIGAIAARLAVPRRSDSGKVSSSRNLLRQGMRMPPLVGTLTARIG